MIFISSGNSIDEVNIINVIDWLYLFDVSWMKINHGNRLKFKKIKLDSANYDFCFEDSRTKSNVYLSDISSYWIRNGNIYLEFGSDILEASHFENTDSVLNNFVVGAIEDIKPHINKQRDKNTNKIANLLKAQQIGIKIPKTLITCSKDDVLTFANENKRIITKSYNNQVNHLTTFFSEKDIFDLPVIFKPKFFQEYIDKLFEIRVFYIDRKIFASAIFSQNDNRTKIDFRNYNYDVPNRTPPFKMPDKLVAKLIDLMQLLDINCGSLDILYSVNKEFVFLEVNPMGQFTQVSVPCNYFIEREIASYLSKGPN
ncbi:MAG: grasp-with-spasm system ATP-grasp peptide maturase [Bacteroidetes bacterium]|nr:grasp-with-spasm system ATP-grasp peptide maturase [Bacteroidota bacterium]